ncbi:hypothetical protein K402DRAFT_334902 [Aulographum hederae CBS 113979]|uniref:C2H2-type domain-containing protein n=1 Tax=Aulographum hederae CBS 113979 TaxID=1176131 RepID=A0A6G1GWN2_9PEZI|nr:hypothetical protein K402DRAFT_334902 [Aulographum hederae CBS 113979]
MEHTSEAEVSPPVSPTAEPSKKIVHHSKSNALDAGENGRPITCHYPGHPPWRFYALEDYELHVKQRHTHICHECEKNFPTSHILELHLAEFHDPFNALKRERGDKTFGCLVEDCNIMSLTFSQRNKHAMDVHNFPPVVHP